MVELVAARSRPAVLLLLSLVGGHAARLQPAPPAAADPDPPSGPARRRIPLARVTGAGAVLAAAPLCYRLSARLLGRGSGEAAAEVEAAASAAGEATAGTTSKGHPAAAAAGSSDGAVEQQAEGGDGARLTLSPERLAQIGRLSEDLTCLTAELVNVPAFFVAFGNTSEPISVPHGDSERIAYFFVEAMDAELFRRRLQQHSPDAQLQVAALSLSQALAAQTGADSLPRPARLTAPFTVAGHRRLFLGGGTRRKGTRAAFPSPEHGALPTPSTHLLRCATALCSSQPWAPSPQRRS